MSRVRAVVTTTTLLLSVIMLCGCTRGQQQSPVSAIPTSSAATPTPRDGWLTGRDVTHPAEAKCGDSLQGVPRADLTLTTLVASTHQIQPVSELTERQAVELMVTSTVDHGVRVDDGNVTVVVTDEDSHVVGVRTWSENQLIPVDGYDIPALSHYHTAGWIPLLDCRSPDPTNHSALPPGFYSLWFQLDGRQNGRAIHAYGGPGGLVITS